jgi:hypothetical protein
MNVKVSIGEAIDKLSILELKLKKISNNEKRIEIQKEINELQECNIYKTKYGFYYNLLMYINEKIWDLTDTVKTMTIDNPDFSGISNDIFEYNQKRFRIKNWFNLSTTSNIKEQKSYASTYCKIRIENEDVLYNKIPEINYLLLEYDLVSFDCELILAQIGPNLVNPGYESGDEFTFEFDVHGILGHVLTIQLNSVVQAGPAGWTANAAASQPPEYPSSIYAGGAVKLTTNIDTSWTFGTDGSLTLPGNLTLPSGAGINTSTNMLLRSGTGSVQITTNYEVPNATPSLWTFGTTGTLTFPDNTVQSTAYVAPTTGNSTIISDPEGTTVSRNGMTIRVTSTGMIQMSFDSAINVKGRSSINNADSVVIALPNGVTTIGTWYNIGAVLAEGDHLTATIVDESYHHIYRLTAIIIQKTTTPGQEIVVSYAIIEQLQ